MVISYIIVEVSKTYNNNNNMMCYIGIYHDVLVPRRKATTILLS